MIVYAKNVTERASLGMQGMNILVVVIVYASPKGLNIMVFQHSSQELVTDHMKWGIHLMYYNPESLSVFKARLEMGLEQPAVVEGVPACHRGLELDEL